MYQNTVEYRAIQRLVQLKRAICQRIDTEERVEDLTLERERQEFDCQNSDAEWLDG